MKFIEEHASKYYLVEETASKKHIQCAFVTRKPYSRSWGNTIRKALEYTKTELLIHKHNDILGAIGYQDGDVLANHGFSEDEINAAKEYYKKQLNMKYYRDHVKTMTTISLAQYAAIKGHIMDRESTDEAGAEKTMVAGGCIWAGMKNLTPYIKACKLRDACTKE